MTAPPAPRPSFFAFAIIDVTAAPHALVGVELSRSDARKKIEWREDGDSLRIRRAKIITYDS